MSHLGPRERESPVNLIIIILLLIIIIIIVNCRYYRVILSSSLGFSAYSQSCLSSLPQLRDTTLFARYEQ